MIRSGSLCGPVSVVVIASSSRYEQVCQCNDKRFNASRIIFPISSKTRQETKDKWQMVKILKLGCCLETPPAYIVLCTEPNGTEMTTDDYCRLINDLY